MSDLENKKTEETPKKRPYNLREKKEKKAAYRSLIRPELADELYDKILNIIVVQKKYKDPDYSAKDLAKELKNSCTSEGCYKKVEAETEKVLDKVVI